VTSISEAEKIRRHRAVASSEGSLAMEGQFLDDTSKELSRRYADGEITLEEFGFLMEIHVQELASRLAGVPAYA